MIPKTMKQFKISEEVISLDLNELKIIEPISLDFYNNNIKTINAKQTDTESRYVKISCTEHGKKVTLNPEVTGVLIACKKPDGYYVLNNCDILEDGTVLVELTQQMLAVEGKCTADLILFHGVLDDNADISGIIFTDDGEGNVTISGTNDVIEAICGLGMSVLTTMSFYVNVLPSVSSNSKIESTYEFNALTNGLSMLWDAKICEKARQENEKARVGAEQARDIAEGIRQKGEFGEEYRIQNEKDRVEAEQARSNAEDKRQDDTTGEAYRIANEIKRQDESSGEAYRIKNEKARVANETKRETTFEQTLSDYTEKFDNLLDKTGVVLKTGDTMTGDLELPNAHVTSAIFINEKAKIYYDADLDAIVFGFI